jgi:hypothetical protein
LPEEMAVDGVIWEMRRMIRATAPQSADRDRC